VVSVAQLVERRIVIPVVAGSNPVVHPTFPESDATGKVMSRHHGQDFRYNQRPTISTLREWRNW
jgi:hypothetical protein